MAKVGVVLSGCGFLDGSEIHEATLTLFFLDKAGAEIVCAAPDKDQMDILDHIAKDAEEGTRNVLREASRIARGDIKDIKDLQAEGLDALILPGGYGAAKNLSDFAVKGPDCVVDPDLEALILKMHEAGKPLGFICIAPAVAAKVLGKFGPEMTIGNDMETAAALEGMGAKHVERGVGEIAVDEGNKIVSTPAYMLGPTISKVAVGIEKTVKKVLEMIE